MKRGFGICVAMAALAFVLPKSAGAVETYGATGVRAEIIASMMDAGGKIMELAAATPDKKYAWRPAKGVRSTNEVFLHVIGANYMIPSLLGANTGKSMEDAMKMEKMTPGKAEIERMLKESYEVASKAIAGCSDSDMEAQVEFFGKKMSKRAVMLLLCGHSHEHLGQSIAYARMNGIVPPWTARDAEAAKKAAGEKKGGGM